MLIRPDPLRSRGLSELKLSQLATDLRLSAAQAPPHRGYGIPDQRCARWLRSAGLMLLFSRDESMHSCGWFKNPQFERCYHLSVSFRDTESLEPVPHDLYVSERIARAFFQDNVRKAWTESPKSDFGRMLGVLHYRVFCDENWEPFFPQGEVYSRELTEKGWQSWSDLHGDAPEPSILHAG